MPWPILPNSIWKMDSAKEIILKPISSSVANEFVRRYHYSGKVVANSQLHFGVYADRGLHGVLSFGPSLDKKKLIGLVSGTKWNEFVELNRLAFDEYLPKNSESRALAVAMRLLRKNAPHVKWVVSFADAAQCGDGTIYRAAGFTLTGFSSGQLWKLPPELVAMNKGPVAHRLKLQDKCSEISRFILAANKGKNLSVRGYVKQFGGELMEGFMIRYVYFLRREEAKNLTVPVLPYSKIAEMGAGMYKGIKRAGSVVGDTPAFHAGKGGSIPTPALK